MRDIVPPAQSDGSPQTPLQVLWDALPLQAVDCPQTRAAARVCALASLAAYSSDPATLCSDWQCDIIPISNDDAELVIFYDDNITLVACRGSEFHLKDWLRNLSAKPVKYRGTTIHGGFADAYASVAFESADGMASTGVINSDRQVVITGHSQGAAVASLIALTRACRMTQWASQGVNTHLVTFGSPRTGDAAFARLMNCHYPAGRHLRFMHSNDIVPRIPVFFRNAICPLLPSLMRRFEHCGTPILITESGEWLITPTRWQAFCSRVKGFRFDLVRDHLMANYLGAIDKCE